MVSETQEVPHNKIPEPHCSVIFLEKKKRYPKALEKSEAGSHNCWAGGFDEGS